LVDGRLKPLSARGVFGRIGLKIVPILGTAVLIGAVVQVILGTQVADGARNLVGVHLVLGLVGLVLVAGLAVIAFRSKPASIYSKVIMVILTLLVLLQLGMGFQLLEGAESFAVTHEANGYLIVVLAIAMGGITMMSARRTRTAA